jgi:uncharacterized membrane protein
MIERTRRNIIAGVVTLVPIVITVWITSLVVNLLISFGQPVVRAVASWVHGFSPDTADFLLSEWFLPVLALVIVLIGLYVLGALASIVVGRRIIALFDRLMERIPGVRLFYGAARRLIEALSAPLPGGQRVVLIKFPTPGMRAVGFVTRTFTAHGTGEKVAAVYVPTTPNPTSGFIEIVPVEDMVFLDWTADQAMQFIITGGAAAPPRMTYDSDLPDFAPDAMERAAPPPRPSRRRRARTGNTAA